MLVMLNLYRNLNCKKSSGNRWSIRRNGKVEGHIQSIVAFDVTCNVRSETKKFQDCLAGGKRSVFAWFETDRVTFKNETVAIPEDAKPIRFNPRERGETYFMCDGRKVTHFKKVWLTATGEAFGIPRSRII